MKKEYIAPVVELIELDQRDVIATSNPVETPSEDMGFGDW